MFFKNLAQNLMKLSKPVRLRFRSPGDPRAGVSFDRESWPHGDTGAAFPHGTVFVDR